MRGSGKDGFTLIELLVVIVIIGILTATAFVYYIDLTQKASDAAAKGVLGAARSAYALYYIDNKAYPTNFSDIYPLISFGSISADSGGNIAIQGSLGSLYRYTFSVNSNSVSCAAPSYCVSW